MHAHHVMKNGKDISFSYRKTLSELWKEMNKRYAEQPKEKISVHTSEGGFANQKLSSCRTQF